MTFTFSSPGEMHSQLSQLARGEGRISFVDEGFIPPFSISTQ